MRALIMAGGAGSRLARGEKPLTLVCGRPMISYITDAFHSAGCEPVVVVSPKTPMTANWCRAQGIAVVRTEGDGYIEDMMSAVRNLEERQAPDHQRIRYSLHNPGNYHDNPPVLSSDCGKDALSTWVPAYRVKSCRGGMPYHEQIGGVDACPAGVNILRGDGIGAEQEEFALLLDEPRLALNVNTREDLARTEAFLTAGTAR